MLLKIAHAFDLHARLPQLVSRSGSFRCHRGRDRVLDRSGRGAARALHGFRADDHYHDRPFAGRSLDRARRDEELRGHFALWRKSDGSAMPVFVIGVEPGGLQPWNLAEGNLDDLSAPGAVAVDRSYFGRLGGSRIGDTAAIREQKARVAVVTRGIRSFTTTPYVFTTIDRARDYMGAPPNKA